MKYQLSSDGPFALVKLHLAKNEEIKIEKGSMVYHNGNVTLEGKINSNNKNTSVLGNMLKSVAKSVVSGESFFVTIVKSFTDDGEINIAPPAIGTIKELEIGPLQWFLNDGVFLACDKTVEYSMKRQSMGKAVFGGTGGLFVMETSGVGSMIISSYGEIEEIELDGSNKFIVDNRHVLAWETSLDYEIKVASGIFGFSTGEGLVNEFKGKGKILIQTRNIASFASFLASCGSHNQGMTFI
ncbi:MAG: TIGR00266 family protein [Firmicutes bacterium]|nr:TIGR00266 family protein [Bacillota bacterium]